MTHTNAGLVERLLDYCLGRTVLRRTFREYVQGLELTGNEQILDYGCRSGTVSREIAELMRMGDGHLTCVDPAKAWIPWAAKALKDYSYVTVKQVGMDLKDIPNGIFDVVHAHLALGRFDPKLRQTVVDTLSHKLKPKGRFLVLESMSGQRGLVETEVRRLMDAAGFKETCFHKEYTILWGWTYAGAFVRIGS